MRLGGFIVKNELSGVKAGLVLALVLAAFALVGEMDYREELRTEMRLAAWSGVIRECEALGGEVVADGMGYRCLVLEGE